MNKDMMNLVDDVKSKFNLLNVDYPKDNQVAMDFEKEEVHAVLAHVRAQGWIQLSLLTCVDWLEENKFQLVFLVFNWQNGIRIQIRAKIDRDAPQFTTITGIYPGAKYYERDVHEFFGVEFEGNPDSYKQLFLENWDSIPPMRKDFNSQEYSDTKYTAREYKRDYRRGAGEDK